MKHFYSLTFGLLCIAFTLQAQPTYDWAYSFGSNISANDVGFSTAIDDNGNIYIGGHFSDTVDFNPSSATANLISNGGFDIFLAKYDASGNYLWAINMGGADYDYCQSLALEADGHIYLTGSFYGTADFDPSSATANLTSNGSDDIFLAKYDTSGNYLWAFGVGGSSSDEGFTVAVDTSGNPYVTGRFRDIADFDPSAATLNLTCNGFYDLFLASYDAAGNYLWAFNIGGTGGETGNSMVIDASGNVSITGSFKDTIDFDPSSAIANLSSKGSDDIFLAKYDMYGNYLWAINMGGPATDEGNALVMDGSGNIYVTGSFRDSGDFNPSSATANLTSYGSQDIFLAKYDASGNYIWAINMGGGIAGDVGIALAIDGSGNTYVTGSFRDTAFFDPSSSVANIISNGSYDIFVAKYDATGQYQWVFMMGGSGFDFGRSLSVDGSGHLYVTGSIQDTVDFDPSSGTANLISGGYADIFLAKYGGTGVGLLENRKQSGEISIYPNPNTGTFIVKLPKKRSPATITCYDTQGKEMLKQVSADEVFPIDGSRWAPGIYQVVITAEGERWTKKMVVVR